MKSTRLMSARLRNRLKYGARVNRARTRRARFTFGSGITRNVVFLSKGGHFRTDWVQSEQGANAAQSRSSSKNRLHLRVIRPAAAFGAGPSRCPARRRSRRPLSGSDDVPSGPLAAPGPQNQVDTGSPRHSAREKVWQKIGISAPNSFPSQFNCSPE